MTTLNDHIKEIAFYKASEDKVILRKRIKDLEHALLPLAQAWENCSMKARDEIYLWKPNHASGISTLEAKKAYEVLRGI